MVLSDDDARQLLVAHCPDALSLHLIDGTFTYASPAFGELVGLEPASLVGRDCYELFHPDDVAEIQRSHEGIVQVPMTYTVTYRIRRSDATYRWVETSSRLLSDEQIIVAATRGIHARRSVQTALELERVLTSKLSDIDRQQRSFMTAIAHRSRHPVTVVMGMAEILARRWRSLDDDRLEDLLERVSLNAQRLAALMEEVTAAERVARRASSVRTRPVDLARAVRDHVATIAGSDAPIHVDIPQGTIVFTDPALVDIALRALLSNAIVHTPVGTHVYIRTQVEADGTLLLVEDDGPGVEPERRQAIFEPFVRARIDDPDPGLGLGLSTVADIAAMHGGRVWVEDRPGGGASFRLLLPPLRDPRAARGTHNKASSGQLQQPVDHGASAAIRALVVDDDASVTELLRLLVEGEGFEVHTEASGEAALRQARALVPDVIILDLGMPGIDGHQVATSLRADARTAHIPIIICSALITDGSWGGHGRSPESFVEKPFDPAHLLDELHRVVAWQDERSGHRADP